MPSTLSATASSSTTNASQTTSSNCEYQITLRNHKDTPVTVEVREPLGGDWEVLNSNLKWTKLDSSTLGFEVPVDKDGTSTVTYKVRVKW